MPARTHGAVLFADISGFTRLMGILSTELGPQRGTEELTRRLNPIFENLVNSIHSFRGSVIVISGDGMTCWFDQDDGRRATTCAFAIQKIITEYGMMILSTGREISLGIKIALAVGPVRRFLVGDPTIQLLEAIAGRELDQVVSIHQALDKGDVAISAEVLKKIEEDVIVRSWRQTEAGSQFAVVAAKADLAQANPWPPISQLDDEVARKWVFASIYERITVEEIEFLTELRQAVPMFVKFTGIDFDHDENAGEKLDQFIRCVQSVLARYEGYLCQLTIGDKGSNVFIAFGAPIAHEDNVNRALAAALSLKKETGKLEFVQPVQIALTQGKLWAGANGGGAARTYSVMGSEVNLAHRLMSHAMPGQILASPHVVEIAPNYSFEQFTPINFKGIEKPMTPFVLIGRAKAQVRSSDRNAMFGRVTERGILAMKLTELTNGKNSELAGILLIEGEAGVGKSLLLADFMEQANQRNVRVLYGETDPVERGTQYYAFRPILESLFDISDIGDPQNARSRVLSFVEENGFLRERAPLLSEILPIHLPDNELTSQMSGESRAGSLREVVLGVLRNSQFRQGQPVPTAIILDDAQWLDSATWNLVGSISRELPSILLIVAMRPFHEHETGAQIEEEYKRLKASPLTQHLPLTSLSLEDIAHLVAQRLGVQSLPLFVPEFIRERSQGNPFFTEQAAYALRDAGIIRIEDGEAYIDFAADELNRIDFPATVQGIITSRIDRLSPAQQLTLKVASVIGRVFLLKMLAYVHPAKSSLDSLTEQIASLTRLGITDLETPTPELAYLFRHFITQEVIYNLVTFAQRKQLHCAVAAWYETNYSDDLSPYYSRLAHHWLKGEVVERATYFLDKAGEQALELYSNEDVVRFISTAIELDERNTGNIGSARKDLQKILQRARWERMLGTAHMRMGQLPESLKHCREALKLLGQPMPRTKVGIVMRLTKELLSQACHRIRTKERGTSRTNIQKQIEDELAQIAIHEVVFYSQNVALLLWATLHRLNLAERAGMSAIMVEGYSSLLMIASFVHNERLINLYRRLAWEAVEQAQRTSAQLYALVRDGVSLYLNCEWDLAGERFDSGMRLADQLGDARQLALLTASNATSLFLQGKYTESLQTWKDTYQRAIKKDRPQELAWGLYGQAHNLLMFGQFDNAILNLEASLRVPMKGVEDKILNASRYGALSLAYFRNKQFDRAFENVVEQEKNSTAPSSASIICYYSGLFDAMLGLYEGITTGKIRLADPEAAHLNQLVERLPKSLNAMKNLPANQAGVWLYKGIYHRLTRKHEEAVAAWMNSLEYARRFNQPYELGRASYELGQHRSISASDRREYLTKACAVFEELKTPYELNLAKSALEMLTTVSMD